MIEINCIVCGEEFEQSTKKQKYCSKECKNKKTKIKKCDWCGKTFSANNCEKFCTPECKKAKKNSFRKPKTCKGCHKVFYGFDGQDFCNTICKQKYHRDNDYRVSAICQNCGKKFSMNRYDRDRKDKAIGAFCSHTCVMEYEYRNNIITSKFSKPHQKIDTLLEELKINYKNEKIIKQYSLDIFLKELNKGIEIMGTYWHGDSRKYTLDELEERQKKCIEKDKRKLLTVNEEGIPILYLWQYDIETNIDLCKKLIQDFINDKISNCHSSSFELIENQIKEKDIKQYMEIK